MDALDPPHDAPAASWLDLGDAQRLLLDAHPGAVLVLGLDGRVQWANAAAGPRFGGGPPLAGRSVVNDLFTADALKRRADALSATFGEPVAPDASALSAPARRGQAPDVHTWTLRHPDGAPRSLPLTLAPLRAPDGALTGLLAVEAPADPEEAPLPFAHHDALTGLPNRAVLSDRAEMALQRAARQKNCVGFLLVELAGFAELCAGRGDSVGDDVLRSTASRLHFELRKTDTAVRVDRGQFVAMLVDLHNADEALAVAEKVRQALSARINVGVALLNLNVRVGVAWSPDHGDQLLPLLQAAEAALRSAPAEGGVGRAAEPATAPA